MEVTAIASFEHNAPRNPGDKFNVSDAIGRQLEKKGLVVIAPAPPTGQPIRPQRAAGSSSSASPAAPASPQTTAILSAAGAALKRTRRAKIVK